MVLSQSVYMIFTHQKRCQMTIFYYLFLFSLSFFSIFLFHFARFYCLIAIYKSAGQWLDFLMKQYKVTHGTMDERERERAKQLISRLVLIQSNLLKANANVVGMPSQWVFSKQGVSSWKNFVHTTRCAPYRIWFTMTMFLLHYDQSFFSFFFYLFYHY